MTTPWLAMGAALLLGACASGPQEQEVDPAEANRPDVKALAIATTVEARTVEVILAARWRDEIKLSSDGRSMPEAGVVLATGNATLRLRGLTVNASESIKLKFQTDPGHEDLFLWAKAVKRFERKVAYGHRIEDASMVTMSNHEVMVRD